MPVKKPKESDLGKEYIGLENCAHKKGKAGVGHTEKFPPRPLVVIVLKCWMGEKGELPPIARKKTVKNTKRGLIASDATRDTIAENSRKKIGPPGQGSGNKKILPAKGFM